MEYSENTMKARSRASSKHNKNHTKMISARLNYNTDKDILEYLETVDNVQSYIKKLIREDIEKGAKK